MISVQNSSEASLVTFLIVAVPATSRLTWFDAGVIIYRNICAIAILKKSMKHKITYILTLEA
jgi:hypothetical protein